MHPTGTRAAVAHLARRAGFGATEQEVDTLAAAGYDAAVETYVTGLGQADATADAVPVPDLDTAAYLDGQRGTPEARRAARQQAKEQRVQLVVWWLRRMAVADYPLREKLTWLWHDHFATSIQKVKIPELMYDQQRTIYELAGGRLDALAAAMVRDPAMLIWLDGRDNVVGRPNENFAREFLELFTLGHAGAATHAGHNETMAMSYTEADVADAARAFTGWRVRRADAMATFEDARHDGGAKTVLGRTGALGADDVVAAATTHPACAPHVVSRLWSRLARPGGPDDPVVRELAEPFAEDLDVTALLRRLFLHEEFLAPATRRGLVKTPVELLVGSARSLGLELGAKDILSLVALGQVPFLPPDVAGWPANEAWLSTSSAQARLALASRLVAAAGLDRITQVGRIARPGALARMLGVEAWGEVTAGAFAEVDDPRSLVTLALISPEHVLA